MIVKWTSENRKNTVATLLFMWLRWQVQWCRWWCWGCSWGWFCGNNDISWPFYCSRLAQNLYLCAAL